MLTDCSSVKLAGHVRWLDLIDVASLSLIALNHPNIAPPMAPVNHREFNLTQRGLWMQPAHKDTDRLQPDWILASRDSLQPLAGRVYFSLSPNWWSPQALFASQLFSHGVYISGWLFQIIEGSFHKLVPPRISHWLLWTRCVQSRFVGKIIRHRAIEQQPTRWRNVSIDCGEGHIPLRQFSRCSFYM